MDISNHFSTTKLYGSSVKSVAGTSEKSKWKLTDSLKEKIVELAKKRCTAQRVYGTHCELVHGKIREVGNDYVVPSSIQQVAVKRYEEKMAELLKDGNWYRMA